MVSITSDVIPWLAKGTPGYNLFSDPPTQPPLPKYILAGAETEETTPQRKIVSRGTEVFVAAGCEIRCVDLRDLKARYDEGKEGGVKSEKSGTKSEKGYQVLDIPALDFVIHQLEVSPDGNYLAIAGEKRVAICMLPAPGFARLNAEKLRAKYHQVGTSHHNDSSEKTVRVIWHPFGVEGASLVVLTSDAVVRVYDFTMHLESTFEVPDQTFDLNALSGRETQRTSFIPDPESFEPASMCFASGDFSWRPFTLYILMRGGDIYALCPIVPSRWLPTEPYLQSLQKELSAQLDALESSTVTRGDKLALRQQAKWLEDVVSQESARRTLNGRKKQEFYTRPECIGPTPKLQGPFLLQPAPKDMTSDEVYACDIIHIASDPVGIISAVWSNGNIDVFLEFEPLQARWVGKKPRQKQLQDSKNSPIISTFETIRLNTPIPHNHARRNWPTFVENPIFNEVFFVAHYSGVEAVDMSGWLKNLKVVADPEEGEDFIVKQLQRTQGSSVKKVLNSGTTLPHLPHPIIGCVVLHDSYVGYILLASSQTKVYTADFDIPFDLRDAGDIGNTLSSVKPARASQQLAGYITSITQPPQDPLKLLEEPSSLQIFMQAIMSKNPQLFRGPLNYNAESLEVLRQAREQVKREYEKYTRVAEILYTQAQQQKKEYERQLLKVHEIIARQEAQSASNVNAKVTEALKAQQALMTRADAVMRQLIRKGLGGSGEAAGMIKSEREREWELELEKIIKRTGFVNINEEKEEKLKGKGKGKEEQSGEGEEQEPKSGFEKRVYQIREVFDELKPLVEKNSDAASVPSPNRNDGVPEELRKKKVAELKEMLEKESFLVNSTKAKVEKLEAKCEEMGL